MTNQSNKTEQEMNEPKAEDIISVVKNIIGDSQELQKLFDTALQLLTDAYKGREMPEDVRAFLMESMRYMVASHDRKEQVKKICDQHLPKITHPGVSGSA